LTLWIVVFLFPEELTGLKCYTCEQGVDCNKNKKETVCPTEPMLMDRCMLMTDNENEKVFAFLCGFKPSGLSSSF